MYSENKFRYVQSSEIFLNIMNYNYFILTPADAIAQSAADFPGLNWPQFLLKWPVKLILFSVC